MRERPSDRTRPASARTRIEPWLDRLDTLRFRDPVRAADPRRLRWHWLIVGVVVIASLWLLRQPLSDWLWPDTRAQQLRADAARALVQGHLSDPDGSGARELYEAALALDPDRSDARAGLARVGQAALAQGRQAVAQRRYADAHRALNLARELAVPREQSEALARELREREAAAAGIDELLARAAVARQTGRLDGDDQAALPLYQRVLELQPTRVEALEGREDTLADLLQVARRELDKGNLAAAAVGIRHVQEADSGHVDLPEALAALARVDERLRRQAEADLRSGRLGKARDGYQRLLAANSDDGDAQRGLAQVAVGYARRSEQLAADFRFDTAQQALDEAQAIAPDAVATAEARQHLARARQAQQRHGPSLSPAERERRLRRLLDEAATAQARGDLLTPPGDSAYDKLSAARALAPRDARVLAAERRLLPEAKGCFERELRGNRLSRANACLDAWRVLEGDSATQAEARRRLARRWIAVGNERLGAGEVTAARAALTSARALDPNAAGLEELASRVRAASTPRD